MNVEHSADCVRTLDQSSRDFLGARSATSVHLGASPARGCGVCLNASIQLMTPFARALSAYLDVTDVCQEDLARRIGRSGGAVSQWLNNGNMPDVSVALRIEAVLEVPFGSLVKLIDPEAWSIIRRHIDGQADG